ncbi:MAG: methyltransferase [Deltaproteobacteria bacterium]|nr:methyltransferase [Deltaproteobacteria bacterium]
MEGWTRETPAPGVVVYQPRRGFRYGAEAFWLPGFALERPARRALELGAGSGVISLLLAARGLEVTGVELRPEWARGWASSLAESAVSPRLVRGEVREWTEGGYDLVVSNPPFFAGGTGPVAPDPWRAAARTESSATLADFLAAGLRASGPGGRLAVVLPLDRRGDAQAAAGPPSRVVVVGRRRVLMEWGGRPEQEVILPEGHPRVLGWYASLRAPLAPAAVCP